MVVHQIALFKLKPELSQADKDSFLSICQEELAKVPYGTSHSMGPPIFDARAQGWEYGLYRTLKDQDEFLKYRDAVHDLALISKIVAERVADMISFQIQA